MESTQSLDPETPTQSVRGMCPDTCVGCAPRGMCPPGSRPCPTIFVLWYSKLSKVVKSFTMVTTAVGNFSPYSRTKRIPRASSPDPQCERPWLLRGHQLSRSLAIATGRRSEKTNFSPSAIHAERTLKGVIALIGYTVSLICFGSASKVAVQA